MSKHYGPKIATANAVLMTDFAVPATVDGSANVYAQYANIVMTPINPSYVTIANGFVTYDRAASANSTTKHTAGGCHSSGNISTVPGIRYNEFYYKDYYTFEIWFRINDITASNYDATETNSFLAGHRGYNIGYAYNNVGDIFYGHWNGSGSFVTVFNFNNPEEILQGQWYQTAVTRNNTTYKKYINGRYITSNTVAAPAINTGVSNSSPLCFGAEYSAGANYLYYAKASMGPIRMYERDLTDAEIADNFAASRGRFGI